MMFGLFLSAHLAHAEVALPTVQVPDFTVGRSWTWDYTQSDGKPWSTERYTVVDAKGSVVVLEISSDYSGGQNLTPNTRLEVDVVKCLNAYSNPVQKKPWSFKMFYRSGNASSGFRWNEFEAPSTLAFEEKFNCNSREYLKTGEPYLTVYKKIDGVPTFQQKLWRRLNSSWFAALGADRGVEAEKEFKGEPGVSYVSRLRNLAK